jgi:integrase
VLPWRPEEARRVIEAANAKPPLGLRDRALLLFLYSTGVRVSEALDVRPRDADSPNALAAGTVRGGLAALPSFLNGHVGQAIGAPAASAVRAKGSGESDRPARGVDDVGDSAQIGRR